MRVSTKAKILILFLNKYINNDLYFEDISVCNRRQAIFPQSPQPRASTAKYFEQFKIGQNMY
jgi:hypothetical protein